MSGPTYYEGCLVINEHYDEKEQILTRYIEKPVEEVRVIEVPKVTYVDVIKQIPEIKIETVEKEVEELYIDEVIKEVPVVREEEVLKHVSVKKVVEVPVETVREVKVDTHVTREEIVEVPGDIVEKERHFEVERPIVIPRYNDTMRPMVYQQLIKPVLKMPSAAAEASGRLSGLAVHEVDVYDYDPVLCKVLIHIPKPVNQPVINLGPTNTQHKWMPAVKDYDHLVRQCNPALTDNQLTGLLSGDSLIQPIPDSDIGGLPIIGGGPLPGTFSHHLISPLKLPPGKPADPKPLVNASYINGIAREQSQLRNKRNPQFLPAISALKQLRNYKYADPKYEKYLKQHHLYFSDTAKVVAEADRAIKSASMSRLPARTSRSWNDANNDLPPPTETRGAHTARAFSTSRAALTARMTKSDRNGGASRSPLHTSREFEPHAHRRASPMIGAETRANTTPERNESPRHRIRSPRKCPVHNA